MNYVKTVWQDLPDRTTPITAARLNNLETQYDRIAADFAWFHVDRYGAVGDGVTDDTAAIRAAGAALQTAGRGRLYFTPGKTYIVSSVVDGAALLKFVSVDGLVVDAVESSIVNPTSYVSDNVTPIFLLDACQNVRIEVGQYTGYELPTPSAHLGYRGTTFVQAINGTDGVIVNARLTNARYGVLTGAYATPSEGDCSNFTLDLRTSFVGYPLAAYLAAGIRFAIDADDSHRPVYVAGCDDVRGVARWKNLYIAPVAVLITDCLFSGSDAAAQIDPVGAATVSRASTNVDIESIDKGSTVFNAEAYCIGLSLSRVDPMAYRNITMRFSVGSTDTTSTTVHGFIINSSAKSIWNRYTYNWEPYVRLNNVKVSGVVDKSALTVSGGAQGPFTIRAYETDATHAATIRGLNLEDIVIRPGSVAWSDALILARGIASPVRLKNVTAEGLGIDLDCSATVPVVFDSCTLGVLDVSLLSGGSRIVLGSGTSVAGITGTTTRTEVSGGRSAGAGPVIKTKELTANLTGASVSLVSAMPPGSIVLGVQGRITTAITGSTGFQVGIAGNIARYANRNDTAVGSVFGPAQSSDTSVAYFQTDTTLVITSKTADFTGGQLRIVISYIEFPALTA